MSCARNFAWKQHEAAFEDGRLSRLERADFAGHCPFSHDQRSLREAWLNGFAVGRTESSQIEPG